MSITEDTITATATTADYTSLITTRTGLIPLTISSAHVAPDAERVAELVESMSVDGWIGAPVLTYGDYALTGTHRLAAAEEAGVDVPALDLCDMIEDADAAIMAIMDATSWDSIIAAAYLMGLVLGDDADNYGLDIDYDPRELEWAGVTVEIVSGR